MRGRDLRLLLLSAGLLAGCGEVLLFPDGGGDDPDARNGGTDAASDAGGDFDAGPDFDAVPATPPDLGMSTVVGNPLTDLFSNAMDFSEITVTVRDAEGNPLAGVMVVLGTPSGGVLFTQPPVTNASGVARGQVRANSPGQKTIEASVGYSADDLLKVTQVAIITFRTPPLVFRIVGDVTAVDDPNDVVPAAIVVGDDVEGEYAFDAMRTDNNPGDTTIGVYPHNTRGYGIRVGVDGTDFNTNPDMVNFRITVTNRPNDDSYRVESFTNLSEITVATIDSIVWELEDLTGASINTDQLLTTPPCIGLPCPTSDWLQPVGLVITGHRTTNPAHTFEITIALTDVF